MKKLFLLFLLPLLMNGCTNTTSEEVKIKVQNESSKKIICILGYDYPNLKLDFTSKKTLLADSNLFQANAGQIKTIDTIGFLNKDLWNKYIKHNLLMAFVFDAEKLSSSDKLEDALLERYYFSYTQLLGSKGVITYQ